MVVRTCASADCTNEIPPQKGPHRPRKYCTTCRPPAKRKNPRVIEMPTALEPLPGAPATDPESAPVGLAAAFQAELEKAGRLATPEGSLVMHLARLMEAGTGEGMTASGAAALSRELRSAMDLALRNGGRQSDSLDDLAKRRQEKAGGS